MKKAEKSGKTGIGCTAGEQGLMAVAHKVRIRLISCSVCAPSQDMNRRKAIQPGRGWRAGLISDLRLEISDLRFQITGFGFERLAE